MASEVIMPQMGFDMKEGTLVRWIKREGDEVASGEIIAEIETDKAVVEIEAFDSGVLRQTLIDEGTTVPVGEVIAVIAGADEEVAERPSPSAASVKAPAMAAPAPAPPPPAPAMRGEVKASPLAKREAQKLGIDIAAVPGTGPNGRVTKKDVTDFAAGGAQAPAAPAAAPPTVVSAPAAGPKRGEVIALSKMRDAIARSMTYSKQHIPHVYLTAVIDMSDAARLRAQLNAALPDDKISFNDMALKACAMALVKHPLMNASYTEAGIHVKERVNVGMAIALETGLIAPALLDTDTLTLRDVAGATKALAGRAPGGQALRRRVHRRDVQRHEPGDVRRRGVHRHHHPAAGGGSGGRGGDADSCGAGRRSASCRPNAGDPFAGPPGRRRGAGSRVPGRGPPPARKSRDPARLSVDTQAVFSWVRALHTVLVVITRRFTGIDTVC